MELGRYFILHALEGTAVSVSIVIHETIFFLVAQKVTEYLLLHPNILGQWISQL